VTSAAARLIGVDWGTTSARAWLLGDAGVVLEEQRGDWGILQVGGDFAGALERLCGRWRRSANPVPIIAAGMVGSRQGWVEAPYVDAPADAAAIASGLVLHRFDGGHLWIVPGVRQRDPADVMRGEETQLLGALEAQDEPGGGLYILPGTHCKWASVEGGNLARFTTCMTGELFALLKQHSILGRTMAESQTAWRPAFEAGVRKGLAIGEAPGGLLGALFASRAEVLLEQLAPSHQADRLSGLLIGAEIAGMLRTAPREVTPVLIGEPGLCERYAVALACAGRPSKTADSGITPRGLWRVAAAAGLLH
jgi:2-dehydro-3-deoxygalactonokinase